MSIFAGRGDVVLAMGVTAALAFIIGWKCNTWVTEVTNRFKGK